MKKRTIFIGDVHGCYDELITLTEKLQLTPEDHLYFTGDIINKGPKSLEVIEWIRSRPNTWAVLGNHEYYTMMNLEDLDPSKITLEIEKWLFSPGAAESILLVREQLESHREWILSLPHYIEKENFILVHGGVHPELGADTPVEIATVLRMHDNRPWYEYYTGTKPIIYGHWAIDGLRIRPNTIGLDTGCCFGGHLTAYILETKEIIQVRSGRLYRTPGHWKN